LLWRQESSYSENKPRNNIVDLKQRLQGFTLQSLFFENKYVSFVANGSILPRQNGTPAPKKNAVSFKSPPELEITVLLPGGAEISGMAIKKGVTVITGGGYSGKSTLLDAVEMGIYNHIPGDGREFVITELSAQKIYAEDGRPVINLDMSPFYKYFPGEDDTLNFSTHHASGSVSQAANIIEAVYAKSKLLLIDEDKSATNFMIRDKNMRVVVEKEPIIPFTDRIKELSEDKGVSTVLVIGGSSEYLSYADTVILMEDYTARDISSFVKTLNLAPRECAKAAASWTQKRSYVPIKTDKQFVFFRTVTAQNQKTIMLDEYSADITLLTSLVTDGQLNHLAAIMEKLLGNKNPENTDLMGFVNDVLNNNAAWQQDFVSSYNFKAERWFEDVRAIDVFCAISRLRGIEIL
jgi:predicted ABC-class ATPase